MCFVPIEVVKFVKFAHAIARILKIKEFGAERMATFGMGIAILSVACLPTSKTGASTGLSCGSCDHEVVAASSIPQGIRGSNHGHD